MDFVDGHTLEDILQTRKVLPEAEVLPWIWQLCDVLEYLHNQNIIFRDLKPSNIMIDHTRQVKLIDFGIVRFFKPGKAHDTIPMGTQGYAAPELMQGRQSTVCSDIYSFGVTLYQLLTGIDPTGLPYGLPPIRQYCPQVSVAVERVITRAVNTDPDKRWQRMAEIRAALGGNAPKAPVGATPYTAPGVGTPGYEAPRRVSRPTTRLVMAAARLSNKQLLAIGAGALFGAALALWFGTPILSQYPVIWNNIPLVAIVAPLVYAAVRRPWIASVAYGALALLGAVITGARRVSDSPTDWRLPQTLVALVLAIILIEVFVRLLPKVRGKNRDEAWQRELAWLCLMAVVTSILMVGLVWGWGFGLNPIMLLGAAGMGALCWFVGDTIQQYLFLKQTGIQRGRGGY